MTGRKANQQTVSVLAGNPRLRVHLPDNKPSWKRYGEGVGNAEFTFYKRANGGQGSLGVTVEETAFANKAFGDKRDVTKTVMLDLDRQSCIKLHRMLSEMLDLPDIHAAQTALRQAYRLMSAPTDYRADEFRAVRDDMAALVGKE